MRITPLAVWAQNLNRENIEKVSFLDSSLTHTSLAVLHCVTAYNIGIAYLINHLGDREGALEAMGNYIESSAQLDLMQWWADIMTEDLPPADKKIGWI